jgi:outer membrane protein assembly factor BamE (lipoprotein component of BamABCDE complex)
MKNMNRSIGIIIILSVFIGGCCCAGSHWLEKKIIKNRSNFTNVEKGMTKNQILELMGLPEPELNETYKTTNGSRILVFFYFTEIKSGKKEIIEKVECTPVVFKDDIVVGWGNEFYQRVINSGD